MGDREIERDHVLIWHGSGSADSAVLQCFQAKGLFTEAGQLQ